MHARVSVVMSVYNGELYLREAVESILDQTFTDFELIIIDDGSIDGTWRILNSYEDPRIRLVRSQENIGLTRSLNKGLALARGEYIARMDANDVSLPQRLEKQVILMDKHPEIGLAGTNCQVIDVDGRVLALLQMPESDLFIRWTGLLDNPFRHPTVVIRRASLTRYQLRYNEAFKTTQDYELWMQLLKYTKGANLSEPLVQYRLMEGITRTLRVEQLRNHDEVAWRAIRSCLPNFEISLEEVSQLRGAFVGGREFVQGDCRSPAALGKLYLDLLENFVRLHDNVPESKALRHREARRVAEYLRRQPYQADWLRLALRLCRWRPRLSCFFANTLLDRAGYYRAKRQVSHRLKYVCLAILAEIRKARPG